MDSNILKLFAIHNVASSHDIHQLIPKANYVLGGLAKLGSLRFVPNVLKKFHNTNRRASSGSLIDKPRKYHIKIDTFYIKPSRKLQCGIQQGAVFGPGLYSFTFDHTTRS